MSPLDRSRPPAPGAVREFSFEPVHRAELPNRLTLLSSEQGVLPVVTLMLVTHAGGEHDRPATAGLAYLTARALAAGTRSRSADRLAWEFEMLGAELDVSALWDAAALAITVPVDKTERALGLLAEVVTNPAFADDEIERLKTEQLSELEQRRAEPRSLAADMASRFLFAPDVPYSRPLAGTAQTVRHLTAEHVRDFYAAQWAPANSALVTVGKLAAAEAEQLAARHFDGWAHRATVPAGFDVASPVERTQVFIVNRDGSVQSELRVGHIGAARSTPDYFALAVANGVLGGVFTSRLNMNLREKHGFTYGVRSGFAFRKQPGPFLIQAAVASDVTARALEEVMRETRKLLQEGASDEEIAGTRDYLAGTLPLEMQTTEQTAGRIADIFIYGLADDYLPQHRAALLAVSAADAARAARDHIHPERFAITIVGDAASIESDIAALELGPIEVHSVDQ